MIEPGSPKVKLFIDYLLGCILKQHLNSIKKNQELSLEVNLLTCLFEVSKQFILQILILIGDGIEFIVWQGTSLNQGSFCFLYVLGVDAWTYHVLT